MQFLKPTSAKKAVAYYRHSAEDKQENSVAIQREHAEKFAAKHNIEIIHEEADEGVSGLIANRPGFQTTF
jgi:DNA invertase Pin-like site-specific DNA recombinase